MITFGFPRSEVLRVRLSTLLENIHEVYNVVGAADRPSSKSEFR
jgi:hypothetical protein